MPEQQSVSTPSTPNTASTEHTHVLRDPWAQATEDTGMGKGEGWAFLTGLMHSHAAPGDRPAPHPEHHTERRVPEVKMAGVVDGARVIRLSFRAGDAMADHSASKPILIMGQAGEIEVKVGEDTFALTPGTMLSIAADKVHSLTAEAHAVATLVVLTG